MQSCCFISSVQSFKYYLKRVMNFQVKDLLKLPFRGGKAIGDKFSGDVLLGAFFPDTNILYYNSSPPDKI